MRSKILFFALCLLLLTSSRNLSTAWARNSQLCQDLFSYEPFPDGYDNDSMAPPIHTPPEAEGAIGEGTYRDYGAELIQQYSLTCLPDLEILSTETLEEGPASDNVDAIISPSGQLLAVDICCDDDARIEIVDLATGSRRKVSDHSKGYESAMFWGSESELFLLVDNPNSYENFLVDRLNIVTGERIPFTELRHFAGLDPKRLAGQFYTGWQVRELLYVDSEDVCLAAHDNLFAPAYSVDGTRLVRREDLFKAAATIVMRDDPTYVSREMIVEMMNLATDIRAVRYIWGYWLILEGLPRSNQHVIISTEDETLLTNVTVVKSGLGLLPGLRTGNPDVNPNFFVAPNLCQIAGTYQSVLYRKGKNGMPPIAIGILPYPHSDAADSQWSPDGNYIYINQFAFGRYSISRLDLTEYMDAK